MHNKQTRAAALPLLALVLIFISSLALAAEPNAVIEAAAKGLAYLDVQLRPKGGKETLRFQIKGEEGQVSEPITLPAEGGADYEITAYDVEGKAVYSGKGFIPSLLEGDRALQLPLPPADKEGPQDGGLVVSLSRERLMLEAFPLDDANNFAVDLQALDPSGNPLKIDPNDIKWGLTDPTHFELLPLKDRFQIELRPKDTFPKPFKFCDVPPVVVACTTSNICKTIRVCPDPFVAVSAGSEHTCALTKSGVAMCWGSNDQGELGSPTTQACNFGSSCSKQPQRVVCPPGAPCRFTQISSGVTITVAIDTNGDTWWWGRGAPDHRKVSATLAGGPVYFQSVTAGYGHGCGISVNRNEVWCWGANGYGASGAPLPMIEVPHTSAYRVLPPLKFNKVVAGGEHTCAIAKADVVCWGRDDLNQTRGTSFSQYPAGTGQYFFQLFGGYTPVLDVAASSTTTCVTLGNNNGVRCWGASAYLNVVPFGTPERLTAGFGHICGVSAAQQASCVGSNNWSELGLGATGHQSAPVAVNAPPALVANISAGDSHTCSITPAGEVFCWGKNMSGQVGNGATSYSVMIPTQVPTP